VHARGLLFFGAPAEQLIQAVGEHRVDLIVLRSHGHQFLGDAMFGATIDAIRHAVSIPVLAVR
jgi:manganese transport protein